jgi:hypothetical protein
MELAGAAKKATNNQMCEGHARWPVVYASAIRVFSENARGRKESSNHEY